MENLKEYIKSLGADLVGFADLVPTPAADRASLPYGIAIGIAINPAIAALVPQQATMAYYDEYERINMKLEEIGSAVQSYLTERGYTAICQNIALVTAQREQTLTANAAGRARLAHKTVAALSGFGWIGKNSLLITEQYGSALRLTSVLTDAPLPTQTVEYTCRCGDCTICADACPGSAIKNTTWTLQTDRDDLIDFEACRKAVVKRGTELGIMHASCGICMALCPHSQKYIHA